MKYTELPHDSTLEKGLFSMILYLPDRFGEIVDVLVPSDFYEISHQQIWQSMIELFSEGREIDVPAIRMQLKKQDVLPQQALEVLSESLNEDVRDYHLLTFVKEIKNKSLLRQIIRASKSHVESGQLEEAKAEELLTTIEKDLISITEKTQEAQPIDARGIVAEVQKDIEKGMKDGWNGYNTGFPALDEKTGGFIPSQVWIVGAYCMGRGTKITMWDGSKKNIESIQVGDLLAPVYSTKPRKVLRTPQGIDDMYEISGKYIEKFIVNKEHILPMMWAGDGYKYEKDKIYLHAVKDFIKKSKREQRGFRLIKEPALFKKSKKLLIPPYLLGLWLGDGNRTRSVFSVSHKEAVILNYLKNYAKQAGLKYSEIDYKKDNVLTVSISDRHKGDWSTRQNNLFCKLKEYNVLGNKHIPREYCTASLKDRFELLAGLIDTDGSLAGVNRKVLNFSNADKNLILQVQQLCESLGLNTKLRLWKQKKSLLIKKWKNFKIYRLSITGNIQNIPIKIERKIPNKTKSLKNNLTFSIIPVGRKHYYGFELDGNHLYLAQNNIVNHNTGMGKTFLILQMLLNVLEQGGRVILFSLEMDRKLNILRMIGNLAELGTIQMMKNQLNDEELKAMEEAQRKIASYGDRLLIYDNVRTTSEIRMKVKKAQLNGGVNVVAIDYIQNLRGEGSIYDRMAIAASDLFTMAQELKPTLLIGSQISQASAGWTSKEAIEFKGAGEIAAVADVALWMVKEDKNDTLDDKGNKRGNGREILLRKVRHGSSAVLGCKIEFPSGRIIPSLKDLATSKDTKDMQNQL